MEEFDYQSYEKNLEAVLDACQHDYWTQYIDVNRHQVNVGKTYLWVSAALLGAYVAVYDKFVISIQNMPVCINLFFILSCLFAIISFGICLYAIPARKGYMAIPEKSWGEFSQKAYLLLTQKQNNAHSAFLTDLIHQTDVAFSHCLTTNMARARLLRFTSWLLIISFALALLSGLGVFLTNTVKVENAEIKSKEVIKMPDSNDKPDSSNTSASQNMKVPDVPVPPPPVNNSGGNITTHSEKGASTKVIRITEGKE